MILLNALRPLLGESRDASVPSTSAHLNSRKFTLESNGLLRSTPLGCRQTERPRNGATFLSALYSGSRQVSPQVAAYLTIASEAVISPQPLLIALALLLLLGAPQVRKENTTITDMNRRG